MKEYAELHQEICETLAAHMRDVVGINADVKDFDGDKIVDAIVEEFMCDDNAPDELSADYIIERYVYYGCPDDMSVGIKPDHYEPYYNFQRGCWEMVPRYSDAQHAAMSRAAEIKYGVQDPFTLFDETKERTAADIDAETLEICTIDYTACADDDDTDLSALGREVVDWMRNGDYWDVCEERSGWTYVSDDADLSEWNCERVVNVLRDGIDTGGWYLLNVA